MEGKIHLNCSIQEITTIDILIATKHEKKEQLQMQSRTDSMVFYTKVAALSVGKD
jgi:hypothetical protein